MVNNINTGFQIANNTIQKKEPSTLNTDSSFSNILANAVNEVNNDIKTAEQLSDKVATGEVKDVHQVMIAMEKANLGLQLTVQVRNKVVEAYQEIMRMQV